MKIDLNNEEINFIYNTLQSGLFIPDQEEQTEFMFNLKRKFIIDKDLGKTSDVRP